MPKTKAKKVTDDPSKPQPQPFPLGMDTTIEEDVVAVPRVSRKRGGDFDDFEGQDDNEAPLKKSAKSISAPRASRKRGGNVDDVEAQEDNDEAPLTKPAKSIPAPRASRKRGGGSNDLGGQEDNDDVPSNKPVKSKTEKPKKNPKVSGAEKTSADSAKPQPQPFPKGMDTTIEEDVVYAPRVSRKRGGAFDDFDDQEGNDEVSSRKPAKSKAEKPTKKPKISNAGGETAKTSKTGVHAVETEKTVPGGDRVEVETTEAPKSKKGKGAKEKKSDAVMEDVAEPGAKEQKPKRAKKDQGKAGPTGKSVTSTADTAKPAAKEAKSKKAKKGEEKPGPTSASDASAAATAKPSAEEAKAKKLKKAEKENAPESSTREAVRTAEEVSESKKPKKSVKGSVAGRDADAPDKPKAGPGRPKKTAAPEANDKSEKGKAAVPEAKEKSKKGKSAAAKDTIAHDHAGPAPELAMDEEPFNALLDSEKGKSSVIKEGEDDEPQLKSKRGRKPKAGMDVVEASAKTPKAPAAVKAKDKKKPRDDQPKEKGKKGQATDGPEAATQADTTNLKKRKAPASAVAETLKSDVLDPLAEHASSKKKQKKSKSSLGAAGDKLGELVTSGLDAASQGADTLKTDVLESSTKGLKQSKSSLEAAGGKVGELVTSGVDVASQGADTLRTDVLESSTKGLKQSKSSLEAAGGKVGELVTSGLDVATQSADTLRADVLESSTKKLKQSKSSLGAAGEKLGELLASGLDAATQGANAAKEYITDAATGAQTSIMGDVTDAAEAVVDAKETAKTVIGKGQGTGKAKDVDASSSSKVPNFSAGESDEGATGEIGDEEDESDFEEDDQTLALIKGFESDEEPEATTDGGQGFKPGQELPGLPEGKQIPKKLKNIKSTDDGPGVVYVGRIPHGFYEHQMRQYFSQFGPIARLRLSRNKRTGASRHYAFIEFESASVAKIVAETMNNYLMFGHILKTNFVTKEQLHEDIWKGADKRFKKVPWSKIEGRKLSAGVGREEWSKRIERENEKRAKKGEKLKEIGYEFEGTPLKGVDTVSVKESKMVGRTVSEIVFGETAEGRAIEAEEKTVVVSPPHGDATMVVAEEIIVTKVKKGGKGKAKADGEEGVAAATATQSVATVTKKAKRKSEEGAGAVANQAKKLKKSA